MEIVFRSDIGQKRSSNQDFAGAFENQGGILLLIWQMAWEASSRDLASRSTVEDIGRLYRQTDLREEESTASWLVQTIQEENRVIYNRTRAHDDYRHGDDHCGLWRLTRVTPSPMWETAGLTWYGKDS